MPIIKRALERDIENVKNLEKDSGLSVWSEKEYVSELSRSDSLFFVAEEKNEFCGFIVARLIMFQIITNPNFQDENEIEIYNLAVKRGFRRKGIGSMLLDKIIRTGEENNVGRIRLEVRKSNKNAIIFYENNFFLQDGERKNFYSDPTENAVLMTLTIPLA